MWILLGSSSLEVSSHVGREVTCQGSRSVKYVRWRLNGARAACCSRTWESRPAESSADAGALLDKESEEFSGFQRSKQLLFW